jgi:ribosome-associated protein
VTTHSREDAPEQDGPERPSKSARKRDAHAAQDLGETLIGLRDAELEALDLPERLIEAIRDARRIPSRGGGARQRQYIGKLMRDIDLEPIRATLAARSERDALESQHFKRAESWRERLILEGGSALDELQGLRPDLDRRQWDLLVSAARTERARGPATPGRTMGPAGRELFRALRSLLG